MKSRLPAAPQGVTLIELMIAIAIIILLTAITVPGFSGFARSREFQRSSDTFIADLRSTQGKAQSGVRYATGGFMNHADDTWGLTFYCSPSSGQTGKYDIIYRFNDPNGDGSTADRRTEIVASRVLDGKSLANPELSEFLFQCSPAGFRILYFERLTGLGWRGFGNFSSASFVTFQIRDRISNRTRNITINRNGKFEVN